MKKEKVLVTGGAGFIGSNLCKHLLDKGLYDVYSLDNYFTGSERNHHNGVNYIKGDTHKIEELIDFIPSKIFHLGEYSRVEQSFKDIGKVWSMNKRGIFSLLEFARKNNIKIIYSGSSTKFGDNGAGKSQSPYAWSKSTNADLVLNYGEWFGLDYAIVYFYNAYGKNEISTGAYATLIGLYCEKIKSNEKLQVVAPGTQKRNFTHVDDIIPALYLVGKKGYGDGYGIGSEKSYTINEIAVAFGGDIEIIKERPGNRMNADLVTEKTKQLGWKPKHDVMNFIKNYLETINNN